MVELSSTSVNLMEQVINNRQEWDRYLILADCLEEEGKDKLSYTIRWMCNNHKYPQLINISTVRYYQWLMIKYTSMDCTPSHLPKWIHRHLTSRYYMYIGIGNEGWLNAVDDLSQALHTLLTHTKSTTK